LTSHSVRFTRSLASPNIEIVRVSDTICASVPWRAIVLPAQSCGPAPAYRTICKEKSSSPTVVLASRRRLSPPPGNATVAPAMEMLPPRVTDVCAIISNALVLMANDISLPVPLLSVSASAIDSRIDPISAPLFRVAFTVASLLGSAWLTLKAFCVAPKRLETADAK
jgi:hypothetical protein